MSFTVHKKGDKHRVVVKETGKIARNRSGVPRDGGGHRTKTKAIVQAAILNRVVKK
jgi:hypothetical protein